MNTVSLAIQSIAKEPLKHAVNAAAGATGVSVAPDYLAIAVGIVSVMTGLIITYKTYQEIKLLRIKMAKEDRREGL